MNFAVADMADELDVIVREIAAHPRADSRFMAAYGLLAELNLRRDQYGVALAVDSSRQTLRHLENMDEGITLIRDVGGAATAVRIGPHFPNDWDILGLARAVTGVGDEAGRQAALSLVVHQTLIKGETRCWEVMPMISTSIPAIKTSGDTAVLGGEDLAARVADVLGPDVTGYAVHLCLVALVGVIEAETLHGGRVSLGGLGVFSTEVQPNGEAVLVFADSTLHGH